MGSCSGAMKGKNTNTRINHCSKTKKRTSVPTSSAGALRVCATANHIISTRVFPSVVIRIESYPNRVETVAFGSFWHVQHSLCGAHFFENGNMLYGGGFVCLGRTCFQCGCCFVMCDISVSQKVQSMVRGHHSLHVYRSRDCAPSWVCAH